MICIIYEVDLEWYVEEFFRIMIWIVVNGFLYNMMCNIIGLVVEIGCGKC